jgi:hypothetical protein
MMHSSFIVNSKRRAQCPGLPFFLFCHRNGPFVTVSTQPLLMTNNVAHQPLCFVASTPSSPKILCAYKSMMYTLRFPLRHPS